MTVTALHPDWWTHMAEGFFHHGYRAGRRRATTLHHEDALPPHVARYLLTILNRKDNEDAEETMLALFYPRPQALIYTPSDRHGHTPWHHLYTHVRRRSKIGFAGTPTLGQIADADERHLRDVYRHGIGSGFRGALCEIAGVPDRETSL